MLLTAKGSIKKPVGSVVQGLRLGDQFIAGEQDEIIQKLVEQLQLQNTAYFSQLKASITRALNLMGDINNPKATRQSYQAYLNFEKNLLGLSKEQQIPTTLLTIVTSPDSSKQFIYKPNIKYALGKGTSGHIYSGIKDKGDGIKRGYYRLMSSQVLGEHLNKFLKSVMNHPLYSHRTADKIHGFAADAFMQHVAQHHFELLSNSISPPEKLPADFGGQDTIDKLVKDSLNSTRWTSGGDVIIIDQFGQVVLNVQLKASLSQKSLVGNLSMKELYNRLQNMQMLLNQFNVTNEKDFMVLAQQIYNMYKTSAVVQNINQETEHITTQLSKGLYLT